MTPRLLPNGFLSDLATAAATGFRSYDEIRLEFEIFGATFSWTEMARTPEGDWKSIDFSQAVPLDRKAFKEDKAASYTTGKGTWFAARLTLVPGQEPWFERFDMEPLDPAPGALEVPVSPAAVQAELALFPREKELVPGWMRELLDGAGLQIPHVDPESNELVLGSERAAFRDPSQ